jgi:hypothetical protein
MVEHFDVELIVILLTNFFYFYSFSLVILFSLFLFIIMGNNEQLSEATVLRSPSRRMDHNYYYGTWRVISLWVCV